MKKDVFAKPFGEMLKEKRIKMGMTQPELAFRSQRSLRFIQQLEAGCSEPTLSTLYGIACAFDMSLIDLLKALPKELDEVYKQDKRIEPYQ